jgi:hypothetical protein
MEITWILHGITKENTWFFFLVIRTHSHFSKEKGGI